MLYKVKYLAINDRGKRLEKEQYIITENSIKACEDVKYLLKNEYDSIGIISVASMITSELFNNHLRRQFNG